MNRRILLLLLIVLTVGCAKNKETERTFEELKNALSNVWIFPESSSYDRLEMTIDGEYELFRKRVGNMSDSYYGAYDIEASKKSVKLLGFGSFDLKSLTANSLYINLIKEEGGVYEEVTLTTKAPEKLLPNKVKHLSKIIDLGNIFYPHDAVDIVYSGDKLYRYILYSYDNAVYESMGKVLQPISKSNNSDLTKTEYSNFVYSADKITFTLMVYNRYQNNEFGETVYQNYIVLLDKMGRAIEIYVDDITEKIELAKFSYTVDGYLENIYIGGGGDAVFNYVYEAGNLVIIKPSVEDKYQYIQFSDFEIENKYSFKPPVYNMTGDIGLVLSEMEILGKTPNMLPNTSTVFDEYHTMKINHTYNTDTQGVVTKFSAKVTFLTEDDVEETKTIMNYEYQYK